MNALDLDRIERTLIEAMVKAGSDPKEAVQILIGMEA